MISTKSHEFARKTTQKVDLLVLNQCFSDNIGESIIYLWVEKLREFLQGKSSDAPAGKLCILETSFFNP